jgi:hypothetical protein
MDHFRRPGRRLLAAAPLLEERYVVPPPDKFPGDAGSIDSAAHYRYAISMCAQGHPL